MVWSLSIGQGIVVQHDLLSWLESRLTHMWAASTAERITQITLEKRYIRCQCGDDKSNTLNMAQVNDR